MNLEQIIKTMDKFEKGIENIEVIGKTVNDVIDKSTIDTVKKNDIDALIMEISDEHSLQIKESLPSIIKPVNNLDKELQIDNFIREVAKEYSLDDGKILYSSSK